MGIIPKPKGWGTHQVEPFEEYRSRLPKRFDLLPNVVIETWIYRHWRDFQEWLPLNPFRWKYESQDLPSVEILLIQHVGNWMNTLEYWGDELFASPTRRNTWLGHYMLEFGTTPFPMIVAVNASDWGHPREHGNPAMRAPYQLIEGHMRLAYLQSLIRHQHATLKPAHEVIIVTLPPNSTSNRPRESRSSK